MTEAPGTTAPLWSTTRPLSEPVRTTFWPVTNMELAHTNKNSPMLTRDTSSETSRKLWLAERGEFDSRIQVSWEMCSGFVTGRARNCLRQDSKAIRLLPTES